MGRVLPKNAALSSASPGRRRAAVAASANPPSTPIPMLRPQHPLFPCMWRPKNCPKYLQVRCGLLPRGAVDLCALWPEWPGSPAWESARGALRPRAAAGASPPLPGPAQFKPLFLQTRDIQLDAARLAAFQAASAARAAGTPAAAAPAAAASSAAATRCTGPLGPQQATLVAGADTFFVASCMPAAGGAPSSGPPGDGAKEVRALAAEREPAARHPAWFDHSLIAHMQHGNLPVSTGRLFCTCLCLTLCSFIETPVALSHAALPRAARQPSWAATSPTAAARQASSPSTATAASSGGPTFLATTCSTHWVR
jgi:hypothetical protein